MPILMLDLSLDGFDARVQMWFGLVRRLDSSIVACFATCCGTLMTPNNEEVEGALAVIVNSTKENTKYSEFP